MDKSRRGLLILESLAAMLFIATITRAAILQDKNPLIGTWIANIEKSKRHPNHLFKSARLRFTIADNVVTMTYSGVNASGVEENGTTVFNADGKEHPLAALKGAVEVSRWVNAQKLQTVVTQNGKVIGESTFEVSADGKTLTATIKGVDESGANFEQIIVCDRE
ncbi:MAG TPA: hypothetical protein VKN18_08380 [Blastocatellia bacterium]|nr:hypothetical protein [Blastocatellia bacterium]